MQDLIFRSAHQFVEPTPYLEACKQASCSRKNHQQAVCDVMAAYARKVRQHGFILEWREMANCGKPIKVQFFVKCSFITRFVIFNGIQNYRMSDGMKTNCNIIASVRIVVNIQIIAFHFKTVDVGCPANSTFLECGPECHKTCDTRKSEDTCYSYGCVPGCFCNHDFVLDDESCIATDSCVGAS